MRRKSSSCGYCIRVSCARRQVELRCGLSDIPVRVPASAGLPSRIASSLFPRQVPSAAKQAAERICGWVLVEAPCFSRGKLDLKSSGKQSTLKRALALDLTMPALKRRIKHQAFPGALKRSFPRINAGASTKKYASQVPNEFPHSLTKATKARVPGPDSGTWDSSDLLPTPPAEPRRLHFRSSGTALLPAPWSRMHPRSV